MVALNRYSDISIGIINGKEYKNELQYSINYYNSIEDYSGNDNLAFWILEKGEDRIRVKIILGCINKNSYSCIFDIGRSDLINFFIGIVSVLVESTMIGMDILDVETLINRSASGTYGFNRNNINDTTEKIVDEIILKINKKASYNHFNRYLLIIRGDVSIIEVNDIANLVYNTCSIKNEIDMIFNSISDIEMEEVVDIHLYAMKI